MDIENLSSDELVKAYLHADEMIQKYGELMGIVWSEENKRYEDQDGTFVGDDIYKAVQQCIVQNFETVRTRKKVWASDLNTESKLILVTLLNLTEQFINQIVRKSDKTDLMGTGDLIISNLYHWIPPV